MKRSITYEVLLISKKNTNPLKLENYLDSEIISANINHVETTKLAKEFLLKNKTDLIFIDLDSFSNDGINKLTNIYAFTRFIPIVVLSKVKDIKYRMLCLENGAADYLLKSNLDCFAVFNAIRQNLERPNFFNALEEAKSSYKQLFNMSPQSIFVYDLDTLRIIDVNEAAQDKYGYSYEEFLSKTIIDLNSEEKVPEAITKIYEDRKNLKKSYRGILKHITKNGDLLEVEIHSNLISFGAEPARIIIANDITKQLAYIKAIENQNKTLEEIAWTQSHVVRAPLVRMMSLVHMLSENFEDESDFYLQEIINTAQEFDKIIHEISEKTIPVDFKKN